MTVTVRIPVPGKGDQTTQLTVEEARQTVDDHVRDGYVATVNNIILHDTSKIVDGQEVRLYPAVSGG